MRCPYNVPVLRCAEGRWCCADASASSHLHCSATHRQTDRQEATMASVTPAGYPSTLLPSDNRNSRAPKQLKSKSFGIKTAHTTHRALTSPHLISNWC